MFGALKPGFRSLATLKLVVNVVGKLLTEKNSCGIARCLYDSTAFLSSVVVKLQGRVDRQTDSRSVMHNAASYGEGRIMLC